MLEMFKVNRILLLVAIFALVATAMNAQEKPPAVATNTNYEAILQLVAASNDSTQKNSLPPNLENISRQIKNDFGYSNYRVVLSSLNRINKNNSGFEANGIIANPASNAPITYEIAYGFGKLRNENNETKTASDRDNNLNLTNFKFGLRVPETLEIDTTNIPKNFLNY
ncbi:MAG: hypothetical protein H7Z37_10635 [Pyrinomonadaceae bacterium]|nr:hypothetical protein [Pyrinomonadaceae bacterium]